MDTEKKEPTLAETAAMEAAAEMPRQVAPVLRNPLERYLWDLVTKVHNGELAMDGYLLNDANLPKGPINNAVRMIRRQLQDLVR